MSMRANHTSTGTTPEMACPRCRAVQPVATECRHCGVVIRKARNGKTSVQPQGCLNHRNYWINSPFRTGVSWGAWSHRLGDAFMSFVVSLAIALMLEWGLLHLMRVMWFLYSATPVGQYYAGMEGAHATTLRYLLQMDLLSVALGVTAAAALVSLASGIVTQMLHLRRLFNEPFGMLANLLIWVPPLTATTGWLVHREDGMIQLGVAYVISLLPTLFLFNRGLYLAKAAVPELATLFGTAGRAAVGLGRWMASLKGNQGRNPHGSVRHS